MASSMLSVPCKMTSDATPSTTSKGIRTTKLPSGEAVPGMGQGTWGMGEDRSRRADEIAALRLGLDIGLTLIDTAEMYAGGVAEQVVGQAIAGRRADVFLVSKVLPNHATRRGTITACEASLRHLNTDHLDLYLLHWRETTPLDETLEGFEALVRGGKIRYWGVSNFDVSDMEDLVSLPGGGAVATDQVLYNLTRRGIELNLLPWCRERKTPIMAYSPIEQGRLLNNRALGRVARRLVATPAQVALAWVLRHPDVIAIPKASHIDHVRENRGALEITLSDADLAELDRALPRPSRPVALEML
jgi:diketogulonate reductase-like aldo/keto reductase